MPWVAPGPTLTAVSGVAQRLATQPGELGCYPASDPGASGNLQWPQGMGQTHLCVGVCDRVIHKDHHQDGDGNAKIPDDASCLPRAARLEARGQGSGDTHTHTHPNPFWDQAEARNTLRCPSRCQPQLGGTLVLSEVGGGGWGEAVGPIDWPRREADSLRS